MIHYSGATYCVLAPEHELVEKITTPDKKDEVKAYLDVCATKSELERTELNKEKTGVFIGAYTINPVNGKKIPIWISDYVLAGYGTGAIMVFLHMMIVTMLSQRSLVSILFQC